MSDGKFIVSKKVFKAMEAEVAKAEQRAQHARAMADEKAKTFANMEQEPQKAKKSAAATAEVQGAEAQTGGEQRPNDTFSA